LFQPETPPNLDNSQYLDRKDVLVFNSEPFDSEMTIEGAPVLEFYASTDCKDIDWFAGLSVSQPDDTNMVLCGNGMGLVPLRARHRNTWEKNEFLEPGKIYKYTITLDPVFITIKKGQILRLTLMNSCLPMYAVNHNTGNDIARDLEFKTANIKVYHDAKHCSQLKLPVS